LLLLALFLLRWGIFKRTAVRGLVAFALAAFWIYTIPQGVQIFKYFHYMRYLKAAGLEMQIMDDARYAGNSEPSHLNGGLYDIFAPTSKASRPAGSWNTACVKIDGMIVEHHLNGERVLRYELESEEFESAWAESRYRTIEGLTKKSATRIALQNHDGQLTWFRNLRIRELGAEDNPSPN
jgi:hypothetical protein